MERYFIYMGYSGRFQFSLYAALRGEYRFIRHWEVFLLAARDHVGVRVLVSGRPYRELH